MKNIYPQRPSYRKRMGAFVGIDVKRDESVIDFCASKRCYNFDFSSGALRDGYGITSHASIPASARRLWIYRYFSERTGRYEEQYVYQTSTGALRYCTLVDGMHYDVNPSDFGPLDAVNYRLNGKDVLLFAGHDSRLMSWDGERFTIYNNAPFVSSMALHFERLFVTSYKEPTKVFFSQNLDPTNWSLSSHEGGFIELLDERGDLNKVVSFANYLYIFRDHGISRVTAYGDQSEFVVVNMFVSAGRIYPESIVKCGSVIVFLASDGLYVFDGYNCTRVLRNLDGLISGGVTASAFYDGKYYLACNMDFKDGKRVLCESERGCTSNGLLVFDPMSGEYSVSRGMNITFLGMCTVDGKDMLMGAELLGTGIVTRSGKRFFIDLPKHWESPITDFGMPDKTKLVRDVYVDSTVGLSLSVCDGTKTRTAQVASGSKRVRVNKSVKRMSMSIDTEETDCNIKPPTVIYSVV